jgi:putative exporter of polyketide antibiotics
LDIVFFLLTTLIMAYTASAMSAVRLGLSHQGVAISFHDLLLAGLNAMAPAALVLGLGIFTLGVLRATSPVVYAALAWSFLIDLLSSGLNLNHWIRPS